MSTQCTSRESHTHILVYYNVGYVCTMHISITRISEYIVSVKITNDKKSSVINNSRLKNIFVYFWLTFSILMCWSLKIEFFFIEAFPFLHIPIIYLCLWLFSVRCTKQLQGAYNKILLKLCYGIEIETILYPSQQLCPSQQIHNKKKSRTYLGLTGPLKIIEFKWLELFELFNMIRWNKPQRREMLNITNIRENYH